ncbi:hypoxanthine phosphoribosyltransferase [Chlorobaculum sp. 24CR]|uniref:hypoxanthine phosphoribosyltransferase n=1 Tax=Chlorobaculum sp. 24CR TaxID=2508878 RepID=UPI00100ACB92|nr:hypoxanthine phosphoribosyltransferase [Chlorobaculum sp. 24CR]RXK85197.1 hypoxanthine phosphoribosyltransferase [Chlorobaculum sp. 24CR]
MSTTTFKALISAERIAARVAELGAEISGDLAGINELTVVCVLKGAFIFAADLVRQLSVPCRVEFIRASSYGAGRASSGEVTLENDGVFDLDGKHVLLVEDIIDTGLTLSSIVVELQNQHLASLRICALLDKPLARKAPIEADYTGFTIPDHFVVGYGLDLDGRHRELPFIAIANR